jgi:hypothetical protein
MTVSIEIAPDMNLAAVAAAAGNGNEAARFYSEGRLHVSGVTQQALEAAAANAQVQQTVPQRVEVWRFMTAAWKLGFVTQAEALAAIRDKAFPALFAQAIGTLPTGAQGEAQLKFAGITQMIRSDGLFTLLVTEGAATDAQIDSVFLAAESIT